MSLEFRMLGPLEVCGEDGRPLALAGPKQRALLALLLLNRNELVATDRLLEEVWGAADPDAAARSLQVYVSQLRKLLGGADVLRTGAGGYTLAVEDEQVDAARFEHLLGEGRRALADGRSERAAELLENALGLWRGPALADLAYEPFAQAEISRLEELRLVGVEWRTEAELALGHHGDLVGELMTLVAQHPLRERLRRQLMLALYRTGRQGEALAVYQDARRALLDELGLDPSPELKELETAILRQDPALAVEPAELRARRHMPAPATALVGRAAEVSELVSLLRQESPRLLTLTGPGGVGKTRLALQAAHDLVDRFDDGVFFVGLAPVGDPALVPSTIARALGVQESAGQPLLESLRAHLRERRLLLVLDNFEHVDDAAPVLGELLLDAPGLKALVTSRSVLRLYGEHEYAVPPLAEEEAVELFAARSRAVRAGFELDGTRSQVVELCRSLDCLPLGIELAAARSGELSLAEMLAVLPHRLELATRGARDLPARQQTLRAAIEWSHDLLDEPEQRLFARLAIFVGGFSLEAVQAVCDAELSELVSLVERHLVVEEERADGEARFGMLETIREYAAERLQANGEAATIRRRHAEHFVDLGTQAKPELKGRDAAAWFARLDLEHGNFRAALGWSLEHEPDWFVRLVDALFRFWVTRGHNREALAWYERARTLTVADVPTHAEVLKLGAGFAFRCGDFALARSSAEQALAVYEELADRTNSARALALLGLIASRNGEHERAVALLQVSVAHAREADEDAVLPFALTNLGDVTLTAGDHDGAYGASLEAIERYRELGERESELVAPFAVAGLAALFQQRHDEARAHLAESLSLAVRFPDPLVIAEALVGLAAVAVREGDFPRAARLLGAADGVYERAEVDPEPVASALREQTSASVRSELRDEGFAAPYDEGRELAPDEAAAFGLQRAHAEAHSSHARLGSAQA